MIKSRRLRWAEHVATIEESRNSFKKLTGKLTRKRSLLKPTPGWEDNIRRCQCEEIMKVSSHHIPSLFPFFSLPDMLCDSTDIILTKGTPFEPMTGYRDPSSDDLPAEVFRGFPQLQGKCQEICAQPPGSFQYHSYH
jgi:hypothetical protein